MLQERYAFTFLKLEWYSHATLLRLNLNYAKIMGNWANSWRKIVLKYPVFPARQAASPLTTAGLVKPSYPPMLSVWNTETLFCKVWHIFEVLTLSKTTCVAGLPMQCRWYCFSAKRKCFIDRTGARERGGVSQHQIYPLKYLTEKSFPLFSRSCSLYFHSLRVTSVRNYFSRLFMKWFSTGFPSMRKRVSEI